jgi:hypothetical protein
MLRDFKIYLESNFIQNRRLKQIFSKRLGVGVKFWDFFWNLDLFSYGKWHELGAGVVDGD